MLILGESYFLCFLIPSKYPCNIQPKSAIFFLKIYCQKPDTNPQNCETEPHKEHISMPNMIFDPKNKFWAQKIEKIEFWGLSPKYPIQKSCDTSQNFCMGFLETPALAECL